jgi:serine/threonine protein kinase
LDKYGKAADMWALGVTLYELVTGKHPFNTTDEGAFRDDALTGNVDWAPLEPYPRVCCDRRFVSGLVWCSWRPGSDCAHHPQPDPREPRRALDRQPGFGLCAGMSLVVWFLLVGIDIFANERHDSTTLQRTSSVCFVDTLRAASTSACGPAWCFCRRTSVDGSLPSTTGGSVPCAATRSVFSFQGKKNNNERNS